MTIVQLSLLEPQKKARRSASRRPFLPSQGNGPYKLPKAVQERLTAILAGYRNAEAAYRLAIFLGRFWSTPSRITEPYPIDRRALAGRVDLDLTESRIRGAIKTLEEVGFLVRAIPAKGSKYQAKGDELHRRPILWQFGGEFAPAFLAANQRARETHERRKLKDTRAVPPISASTMSMSSSMSKTNSPKSKNPLERTVLMGDQKQRKASTSEPNPRLEAALQRLGEAFQGRKAVPGRTDSA